MKEFFSIGKTAKIADVTTETLRHYDRIGLVKPCKTDKWSGYRYYSQNEIVRLNVIHALRYMDLSLEEIKKLLEYDDIEKIIDSLKNAEKKADEKIRAIDFAKNKIQKARNYYEEKLQSKTTSEKFYVRHFPRRIILLSKNLHTPTIDNLWDYHRHFYEQTGDKSRNLFAFEDVAGIYCDNERTAMFAVCSKYIQTEGLITLPEGDYVCADFPDNNLETEKKLLDYFKQHYGLTPEFIIKKVVVSGIIQWNYQFQVYLNR